MSLDIEYHPLAAAEIADAEDWYEHQNEGLGDRFLAAVEAAVNRASRWPNAGAPVTISDDGTIVNRKVSTGGFPWAVGYGGTDRNCRSALVSRHRPEMVNPDAAFAVYCG